MSPTVGDWVRAEYRKELCDEQGRFVGPTNLDRFRTGLYKKRPEQAQAITAALKM
jgi:hypothetical protein